MIERTGEAVLEVMGSMPPFLLNFELLWMKVRNVKVIAGNYNLCNYNSSEQDFVKNDKHLTDESRENKREIV